jgi:F-type H+-transporting ATPase subunit b
MNVRRLPALAVAVALPIVTVARALAEEGGHGGHAAEHHAPGIGDLLFPAINFAIFVVIIVRFVVPAAREYLRRRHEDVTTAAQEAATALSAAERAAMEIRARLAAIATESETIKGDLVTIASGQADRTLAQAAEAGKRRVRDAELLAEQERRHALAEVREETAARATSLAEARIRAAVSPQDQAVFVREFLAAAPAR